MSAEELAALDPRNYEPECTCQRVDVDLYDVRGCELCDPQSQWNRDCKAWDRAESHPGVMAAAPDFRLEERGVSDDEAPF